MLGAKSVSKIAPKPSAAWSSSASRSRHQRDPSASPAGGCALRSSPQRLSKRLSIPPRRPKNEHSADAGSPKGRQSFVRLALISRRRRRNEVRQHNEVAMISVLIGVLIIVVVGAICFWAIDKFATDRRLSNLLKLLVVLVCLGAIVQRVLPLTY